MRHVPYNPKKINYPAGWQDKANAAIKDVQNASADKRSKEIDDHCDVWADLKPELAKIMNHKCWYTESPQAGTDTDVDHFRPKKSVKDVRHPITKKEHPGYWWRAFDPTNYRYSCIVANRRRRDIETGHVGGKADEFPISDETKRAWKETADCTLEQPLLIDPCDPADVALITFAENGEATPRHSESAKPRLFAKADRSIYLYHLNHSDFLKARIAIRDELAKLVEDARQYYKYLDSSDANVDHAYMRAIEQMREACNPNAPFSSFAVAMLAPNRLDESLLPVFV